MNDIERKNISAAEKPPIFGSWKIFYVIVLLNLFAMIGLFYFFPKAFE